MFFFTPQTTVKLLLIKIKQQNMSIVHIFFRLYIRQLYCNKCSCDTNTHYNV